MTWHVASITILAFRWQPLSRLVHLQLDHNSIQSIDLDAFTALLELKSVSLSHNRLATFDKRIFEQNNQLVQVNLAGNNFMDLKNAPILQSQSLEELDLKESKLTHLHSAFFGELPRLRSLDLAKNLLITINVAAFERNLRLEVVKIDGNPFTCDMQMEMTLLLMKRRNIKTRLKFCRAYERLGVNSIERLIDMYILCFYSRSEGSSNVRTHANATGARKRWHHTLKSTPECHRRVAKHKLFAANFESSVSVEWYRQSVRSLRNMRARIFDAVERDGRETIAETTDALRHREQQSGVAAFDYSECGVLWRSLFGFDIRRFVYFYMWQRMCERLQEPEGRGTWASTQTSREDTSIRWDALKIATVHPISHSRLLCLLQKITQCISASSCQSVYPSSGRWHLV